MTSHTHKPSRQRGSVLVLVTIGLVALLAMSGLALDMGHAYLMKTRLQNALDAAVLSGAKTLDETGDPVQAEIDARNTFSLNAAADMNDSGLELTAVEFSDILFDPAQAINPRYIRVSLAGYQQAMWFAQILPGVGNNKVVSATAVAGPSPKLGEICDILPVMICGDTTSGDTDCTDGACYGYSFDPYSTTETVLKTGSGTDWDVGPGNYQLIRLGDSKGGSDIRDNLAGSYENCLNTSAPIETEPGNTVGPVAQGLNTRFGIYQGPFQQDDKDIYKPDLVSDTHAPSYYYSDYESIYSSGGPFDHPDGEAERRIVAVPIGDCSTTTNGQGSVPLLDTACFFLTRPAEQNGDQRIYGQFVNGGCKAHGTPGPDPATGPGPYIIQLYKDPDSPDA